MRCSRKPRRRRNRPQYLRNWSHSSTEEMVSSSRYGYPRFRAARYVRIVGLIAWAVVPVARKLYVRRVIREDRPEPEPESEPTPLEVVMVEVASPEVMPVEAMVLHGSTAVTAPKTVPADALCLAGSAAGQHDRQYGEHGQRAPFRICNPLHLVASLIFPAV